eukprot:CAMPEP_0195525716 /NCGR_PEP_ID=MMETSP0794_2-20130614/26302_1 /TAXON_ID=515487 /ORGANISM="Stephanopyxis turris, Strain CCMP 815" /LENGTH=409 /DNA_ID=CAMNT_0040656229 /DNA_START=34 /DNA_END=1263 /DNA_ORIENTATION=+
MTFALFPSTTATSLVVLLVYPQLVAQCSSFAFTPQSSLFTRAFNQYDINANTPLILTSLGASKGFGASKPKKSTSSKKPNKKAQKQARKQLSSKANTPFVKADNEKALADLAAKASNGIIGKAVASSTKINMFGDEVDEFWDLIPSLLSSKFPRTPDSELTRIAGFIEHTLNPALPLEESIVQDKWRPHEEIHAFMPGLGEREPFLDTSRVGICKLMSDNYEVITKEYEALVEDMEKNGKDRFQSVTSMNYEAGWKTLVLFYNGHRIPGFPYHLCPTTTQILETVPIAGRIAGFNRQKPNTGIPLHSDGNNMWLTCQMGVKIPKDKQAYIRVGPETRYWANGDCLLYDTTYEHETMNKSDDEERVVLHVDFFNTLAMTPIEIEIMQYIYEIREKFMKAEGVAKVGAQVL